MGKNSTTEKAKESRPPWSDLRRVHPRTDMVQSAEKWWWGILLSLPLDFLMFNRDSSFPMAEAVFFILVLASLASLWRRKLFLAGLAATQLRKRLFMKTGRWTPLLLLGIMAVGLIAEVAPRGDSQALLGTLVTIGAGLLGLIPAYKAIKEKLSVDAQLNRNRILALSYLETQAFGLCVASFVPARLLSTVGIIAFGEYQFLPLLISLGLLILLRPREEDFTINCPRCFTKTSIAFSGVPYCHACARKAFRQKPLQIATG